MSYSLYAFVADAVLVLILVLGIIFGWRRGFVRTVAKPVKLFAALVLAFTLCTVVADAWIQPLLQAPMEEQLTAYLREACAGLTADNATEELPALLKMAAGMFDIDINEVVSTGGEDLIRSIVTALAEPVAHIVATLAGFLVVYIAARILLWIVVGVLAAVFNIGILGLANRILGVIFSLLFAVVMAWGVVTLSEFLIGIVGTSGTAFVDGLRDGLLYRFFNEYTPLDILLSF